MIGYTAAMTQTIRLNDKVTFANTRPLALIGGTNAIESRDIVLCVQGQL